jgi:DNA adenine methylase
MQPVRPFLKWAGGKTQLLPALRARIPAHFNRYHEPFVGSAALFWDLYNQEWLLHGAVLSDVNPTLIEVYCAVRDDIETLLAALREHEQHKMDREYFYEVRNWDRQPGWAQRSPVERAARMIFLNRTCYNGLHRVNRRGQFNVPFGRYANPLVCNEPNLRAAHRALQHVDLLVEHFCGVLHRAQPGDLVYFDPPYLPLSPTSSFTSYSQHAFGVDQHRQLAEVFAQLAECGCHVLLSNSSAPLVYELYGNFQVDNIPARRAINSNGGKRGVIDEVLVSAIKQNTM